jgi:hypothetical protein
MRLLILFVLLITFTGNVFAGENRFYVSAQAGLGAMQTPELDNPDTYDIHNFTWRYSGGYLYQTGKMEYGVEFGHNAYEDNTYGKAPVVTRFRGRSNDLLFVVRYDFYQHWHIFSEVGPALFQLTTESSSTAPEVQHQSKVLPELAFGFGYGFNDHFALNLSFDYEFGNKPNLDPETYKVTQNSVPTTSSILAGFSYTF